jgi:hypothetical protein
MNILKAGSNTCAIYSLPTHGCLNLKLLEVFHIWVNVLQATGDQRARDVLEGGYAKLQECATKIKDEGLRRSFLENVPYNREMVKLWEEQRGN